MDTLTPAPPRREARWTEQVVGGGGARPLTLLTTGPQTSPRFYLPKAPRLASGADGRPQLALTLVLDRAPLPDDPTLDALIRFGQLAFTATLAVPAAALEALAARLPGVYRPLFAREAHFELLDESAEDHATARLCTADASGPEARAALSVTLDRPLTRRALAALNGQPSGLCLRVQVSAPGEARTLRLQGDWAAVFDALALRSGADHSLAREGVEAALRALLGRGDLRASLAGTPLTTPDPETLGALAGSFIGLAGFLLSPLPDDHFRLGVRPPEGMTFDLQRSLRGPDEALDLSAPLEALFAGQGEGAVHLVSPQGVDRPSWTAAPSRVRTRAAPQTGEVPLAAVQGHLTALPLALTPDLNARPSAGALIASDVVGAPVEANGAHLWLANDLVLDGGDDGDEPPLQNLPLVQNVGQPWWPDARDGSRSWYPPTFSLVMPTPDQDPATSPFLFSFAPAGVTSGEGGLSGGLTARLRLTLRPGLADDTRAALGERLAGAQAIPAENLSVTLLVPYRSRGGPTQTQGFAAGLTLQGDDVVASIDLLDDWVKLCYGALSTASFQAQPAQLQVAYSFRAYNRIPTGGPVVFGGKRAEIELGRVTAVQPARPTFDPTAGRLHLAGATLTLAREADARLASRAPQLALDDRTPALLAAARPELTLPSRPGGFRWRPALRTVVRQQTLDAFFPCDALGGLYRQGKGEGVAVGCQDALKLGETSAPLYQELTELRHALYRVHASRAQPGHFLVVPASYRITRYGAGSPPDKAYHPTIWIYSVLGATPDANRYFFQATLQPDLPRFEREALSAHLAPLSPHGVSPTLEYPTDPTVLRAASYAWSRPAELADPSVLQTWDGLQVAVSTSLVGGAVLTTLIETAGLNGTATFTLADGSSVSSALVLDTAIVGPWDADPVSVEVQGVAATLTNRVEQTVNVLDLVTGVAGGEGKQAVNAALVSGASLSVTLDAPAPVVCVSYAPLAGHLKLKEMPIVVEDIQTNVLFVNLVNYANHQLSQLSLSVRLKDSLQTFPVALVENQTSTVGFTLPLTSYLEGQVLQWQATLTFLNGPARTTDWADWNLTAQGTVISVTKEFLSLP